MIHGDVWGPSKIKNIIVTRWFVSFVDDHTRISWIFLMKEKSEVSQIFKNFYNMIQTQFHAKIQVLKINNVRYYFNSILGVFLLKEGVVHQKFCINTPQQNGIGERKNRHLLEVARVLMLSSHVPKNFRGKTILTATYLINRMSSHVWSFQTPCKVFLKSYLRTRLISSIPLKLFGCPTFVHIPQQHQNKLDPKATKCIFLKYSINQKGYKCYFPVSKRFYNSMDVTFLENRSYYSKTDMQGENRIREY